MFYDDDCCYSADSGWDTEWSELGLVFRVFFQCYEIRCAEEMFEFGGYLAIYDLLEEGGKASCLSEALRVAKADSFRQFNVQIQRIALEAWSFPSVEFG